MKSKELKPGGRFRVTPPDPEGPVRVCLTNDKRNGIRWGFPGRKRYWCYMGDQCEVELLKVAK